MSNQSKWEIKVRKLESEIIAHRNKLTTLKSLWYVPESNGDAGRYNGTLFLGINSGGESVQDKDKYYPCTDKDGRGYYHDEDWEGAGKGKASLQIQVRILFSYLNRLNQNESLKYDYSKSQLENLEMFEGEESFSKFITGIMAGNICPFQSSNISTLLYQWSLQEPFLVEFWKELLSEDLRGETKRIFVMGDEPFNILKKVYLIKKTQISYMKTGWGNTSFSVIRGSESHPTIVKLPHLSWYKIFGREESDKYINDLFEYIK